ncbi:MAG: DUF4282 domain-containing protein [Calditrichia bacterium]|nr:DUF4282 domain-containing protein [Calditrichia bacterium]
MSEEKGFLQILFNISFNELITLKIIRVLYLMGILFSGIGAFYIIIEGFSNSFFSGLLALIFSPLVFLIYVVFTRVILEIIWSIFKIAENTDIIVADIKKVEKSDA